MNRINLIIISSDKEYADALGKSLMLKESKYLVHVHKELGTLDSYINDAQGELYNHHIVMLIDSHIIDAVKIYNNLDKILCLELGESAGGLEDKNYIYKYQGLENINSQILYKYAEKFDEKKTNFLDLNTGLIGFTSAAGGVGSSCIAISLAREMTMTTDKRILYLNHEKIESTAVYFPGDNGRETVNEYLYYLFKKRDRTMASYIDVFIKTDLHGLSTLRPARLKSELWDLTPDELIAFIKSLHELNVFDHIFVDFPFDETEKIYSLLRLCNKILLVDDGKPLSNFKNERVTKNSLADFCNEAKELENKIITVTNKWEENNKAVKDTKNYYIEYDPDSFSYRGNEIEINLTRRFGLGIRRMADEFDTWL